MNDQHDPLDRITDLGWEVLWSRTIPGRIVVLTNAPVIVADPNIGRAAIADRLRYIVTAPAV